MHHIMRIIRLNYMKQSFIFFSYKKTNVFVGKISQIVKLI